MDTALLPLLSLGVAFLAVIVGPWVSLKIAKKQMATSLEVARLQATAPIGQTWARELSDALAEFLALSLHYFQAGFEDRKESEYQRLTFLEQKTLLLLDPNDEHHAMLISHIKAIRNSIGGGDQRTDRQFADSFTAAVSTSRRVLLDYVPKVQKGYVDWEEDLDRLPLLEKKP